MNKLPDDSGPSCFVEMVQLPGDPRPCLYLHVGGWGCFRFDGRKEEGPCEWNSGMGIGTSANKHAPGRFIGGAISRNQVVVLRDYMSKLIESWDEEAK